MAAHIASDLPLPPPPLPPADAAAPATEAEAPPPQPTVEETPQPAVEETPPPKVEDTPPPPPPPSPATSSDNLLNIIDKNNVYRVSKMNEENQWVMTTYVPPQLAIESMNKSRAFIEANNIPFEVCCISGKRICIRNNEDINDISKSTRLLYKAIFKTTEMGRCNNPYYNPNALVWDAWDQDATMVLLNFDFDKNNIKNYYLEYKEKFPEIDEWSDSWLV